MQRLIKVIIALLIYNLTYNIYDCFSQWQWLNPYPTANNIYCIRFVNTQTGYAACEAGTVLKTTNGGLNWSVKMLNNSSNLYTVHFINANTGMVAGEFGAADKTINGGNNWVKITINDSVDFRDIRFRNAGTGILVTGYNNGNYFYYPRIYKTSDGGLNWTVKQYDYSQWWLRSISFASNNKIFVAGERVLYESTDAGETWDTVASYGFQNMGNRSVWFANSSTGYVLSNYLSSYLINKTTDGGSTWIQYNTGSYHDVKSIAFVNANTGIVAGSYTGVFRTTNGGLNWIKFSNAVDSSRIYYSVTNAGANRFVYAGDGGIIYRSINSGANFTRVSKSFTDETITSVSFINNQTGVACGNNGTIFKTINGGINWTQANCPGAGNFIKVRLFNNTGFAVASNGRIYKTIDAGSTWNTLYLDTLTLGWGTADIPDINTIHVTGGHCSHSGVITTDGGLTWNLVYLECECHGPPETGCISEQLLNMASSNVYFIAGYGMPPHMPGNPTAVLFYNGGSANYVFNGYGDPNVLTFADYADTNYGIAVGGRGRVMRTSSGFRNFTDYWFPLGGFSWINYLSLVDSINSLANICYSESGLITSGIYKSTNGGLNWALCGVVSNSLTGLKYYNFNFAVSWGPYGGIISNNNPGIILQTNPPLSEVSASYKLYQNYPNPFNPVTIIRFQIPNSENGKWKIENGVVTLKIFDILGKEIETLVNENLKPGTYEVKFDGSKLASGIYFYTLTAGEFKGTKKLILLK
jgi:photosystem II stability/assembly factor-like uncharacterized protein